MFVVSTLLYYYDRIMGDIERKNWSIILQYSNPLRPNMRANRKINPILVTLVKEIGNSFSSKSIPKNLFNGGIEMINKELQKKELH